MKAFRLFTDQYEGSPDPNLREYAWAGHVLYAHKATQGTYHTDSKYADRVVKAQSLGLVVMHYHYCDPVLRDPRAEAEYFWDGAVKHRFIRGDKLALDFEYAAKLSPRMLEGYIIDFWKHLLTISRLDARIYGSTSFLESECNRRWLARRARWQAQYGPNPHMFPFGRRWWAWQFTDGTNGPEPHRLPGIATGDIDMLRLDVAARIAMESRRRRRIIASGPSVVSPVGRLHQAESRR